MSKKIVEAILARNYSKAKTLIESAVRDRLFAAFEDDQNKAGNKVTSTDDESPVPDATKGDKPGAGEGIPDEFEDDGEWDGDDDFEYGEVVTTEAEILDELENLSEEELAELEKSLDEDEELDEEVAQSDNVHPVAGDDPEDEFPESDSELKKSDFDYGEVVTTESEVNEEDDGDNDEDDKEEKKDDEEKDEKKDDEDKNESLIVRFKDGYKVIDMTGKLVTETLFKSAAKAKAWVKENQ